MKIKKNKNAIGIVVTVSMLIVVAFIAVVSFQTWFLSYSSSVYTNALEKNGVNQNLDSRVEELTRKNIYFRNGYETISINDVKISSKSCDVSTTQSKGLEKIPLGNNCTQNISKSNVEVVVYTDKGVYSKEVYFD